MRSLWVAVLSMVVSSSVFANQPDMIVKAQLESKGVQFEVDSDGDFKAVYQVGKTDRTQIVFIRTMTTQIGNIKLREIWSPAYKSDGPDFPVDVANRLLTESNAVKIGGWVKQGQHAVFVAKIAADAPPDQLISAIEEAINTADAMELVLTQKDDF